MYVDKEFSTVYKKLSQCAITSCIAIPMHIFEAWPSLSFHFGLLWIAPYCRSVSVKFSADTAKQRARGSRIKALMDTTK